VRWRAERSCDAGLMRGARWACRRARNSSCDAGLGLGGGEVGEEKDPLEVSAFGVWPTHSQSSNELASLASSEQTRGARSEWRHARNSSCDALGGAEIGLAEESLDEASFGALSTAERNELVSFASSKRTRGARWVWRCARSSSCDAGGCGAMKSAEVSMGWCEGEVIGGAQAKDSL